MVCSASVLEVCVCLVVGWRVFVCVGVCTCVCVGVYMYVYMCLGNVEVQRTFVEYCVNVRGAIT